MLWGQDEVAKAASLREKGKSWQQVTNELNTEFGNNRTEVGIRVKLSKTKTRTEDCKRVMVYGDIHYPYSDDDAVAIMLEIAKAFDPDTIIVNGDMLDFHGLSKFRDPRLKVPPSEHEYHSEIELSKNHLRLVRQRHPNAEIIYNLGNHEERLFSYICDYAPALLEFDEVHRALSLPHLLELDKLEIKVNETINGESYHDLGNLWVGHWKKYSKHSGGAAKLLVEEFGISLIQGHTHHMGVHHKTWAKRQVAGYEGGCLCDLLPNYRAHANWQHGFCLITFVGKFFRIEPVDLIHTDNMLFAIYGGNIYRRETNDVGAGNKAIVN